MSSFQELEVWRLAHEVALDVYRESAQFPRHEVYGITSQLRRAAASIPTNIAEGSARGPREFHQFLRVALGSAAETEYLILLARDLQYLSPAAHARLDDALGSVKRMLVSFMRALHDQQVTAPNQRPTANSQRPTAKGQWPGALP